MKLNRHRPDFILLIAILLLVSIGLLTIYSASIIQADTEGLPPNYYFIRQFMFALVGLVVMFGVMNTPYWIWRKMLLFLLPASFLMLIAVFLFPSAQGAHRWIRLGGSTFQPSELATITVIVYVAHLLTKKQDKMHDFKKAVIPPLFMTGIFVGLIIIEPDMDAAFLVLVSVLAIMFAAGIRKRHLSLLLVPVGVVAAIFLLAFQFRRDRLFSFLDPFSAANFHGDGWQLGNSLLAIASGGWTGTGLGRSVQKFGWLPAPHTDFIFAIFLEEWGTIGGILLICLFAVLIWRATRITTVLPDRFGSLLAVGVAAMIGFAVLANIGMVTGMMPVMGIPLPFITYGGTALVLKMFAMGILLSLSRYTQEDQSNVRR